MRTRMILMSMCLALFSMMAHADETVTVTATSADISEDLDLKTVATLFGQAKDLEEFEKMLNNPDSAFSNLDLNGDGNVDYLRVIETADQNRHLIVIQAVLAKDIYQDVASIFVEKDEATQSVTVQVIGDEYVYGTNYIIEPVYIYRPVIYDWFWGPSWVCWHSPFYWDYWPIWWRPYHCIAHHMYWEHMYWYHHHHPYCSYRTAHHYHPHYKPMRTHVSRSDYATRHPERSFASRHASTRYTNARDIDRNRQAAVRSAGTARMATDGRGATTRVSTRSTDNASRTFGSTNVRTTDRVANTSTRGNVSTSVNRDASRSQSVSTTRSSSATRATAAPARTSSSTNNNRSTSTTVTRPSSTPTRSSSAVRSSSPATRSSSAVRSSSSSSSTMRSSGTSVRSSGGSSTRSSGGYSGGGSSSSSRGGGGSTRR